jgi:steroid 5-alpha reductase family enzyme
MSVSAAGSLAWAGLAVWLYVTVIWLASLIKRDTGIVDVFWGPGFLLCALIFHLGSGGWAPRSLLILALVALWGLRLGLHIGIRNHGQPEDKRYRAWRQRHASTWWWRSYVTVFLLQGVLLLIISLPLWSAQSAGRSQRHLVIEAVGLLLWLAGFVCEAVSDWQLARFKRDPNNRGRVLDSGLWRYSRHPNYFGETLVWWGFFLLAVPAGRWWVVISPLLITILLLKFSGVTLLEKTLTDEKPQYRDYVRRTHAFIPWPPKD